MDWLLASLLWLALGVGVLLASTVVFDVVHVSLHRLARSRWAPLRAIGSLHTTHHRFLDRDLVVRDEEIRANLRRHVIPEYLTQLSVSAALLAVLPAPAVAVSAALQTAAFLWILSDRGVDVNHRGWELLPAYHPFYFCLPEYHAWHHVHPDSHYSSWIKTLDHLLATGTQIAGRRLLITGAASGLGAALAPALEAGGAEVRALPDAGGGWLAARDASQRLRELDVLVLAHPSEADAKPPFAEWIEAYCAATEQRRLPPEVWAVVPLEGPDARDPASFARQARRYYQDRRVVYRQLVLPDGRRAADLPAADARRAAKCALRLVRRGFNYAPLGARAALAYPRFRRLAPAPPTPAALASPRARGKGGLHVRSLFTRSRRAPAT